MGTSIDISKSTGRLHKNVVRIIKKAIIDFDDFRPDVDFYKSVQNKKMPMYRLNEKDYEFILNKCNGIGRENKIREDAALKTIEQILNIKLLREYKVGIYRIDGYHKETNTAYEIDETQHFKSGKLRDKCIGRQDYIESKIGCNFIRVKV